MKVATLTRPLRVDLERSGITLDRLPKAQELCLSTGAADAKRRQPQQGGGLASRDVYALAGMPFDVLDLDEAVHRIEHAVQHQQRLFISTPNSNFAAVSQHDAAFRRSVLLSDLVVPDGMPLVYFAKLQRLPVQGRITGADLFENLLTRARCPIKVFFFGGPDGAAAAACQHVNEMNGPVRAVGFASPGYVSLDALSDDATLQHINDCEPDFVVVSLGASKGQAWILRNQGRLNAPVLSHLGAVVNFTAGSVRRAPRWVQKLNAEWLWRIYQEPMLWRRYWHDAGVIARLFTTQVGPNMVQAWRNARTGDLQARAQLQSRYRTDGTLEILLSGHWRRSQLRPLADALQTAIDGEKRVEIHADDLKALDACSIGLLMLAQVRVPDFAVLGASDNIRAQLRQHGAADMCG